MELCKKFEKLLKNYSKIYIYINGRIQLFQYLLHLFSVNIYKQDFAHYLIHLVKVLQNNGMCLEVLYKIWDIIISNWGVFDYYTERFHFSSVVMRQIIIMFREVTAEKWKKKIPLLINLVSSPYQVQIYIKCFFFFFFYRITVKKWTSVK